MRALTSAVLLCFCGCSVPPGEPNAPDGGGLDSGTPDAGPPGPWAFAPDPSSNAAVTLRLAQLDGDRAVLEVVARDVASLGGVAFRLAYDPAALTLVSALPGAQLSAAVARFHTRPEGELWAGLGFPRPGAITALDTTVLARVDVQLSGRAPVTVSFPPGRNLVVTDRGAAVVVQWAGGTFSRQ